MKKYEQRIGQHKDLLAIQTDYNYHINYIRVDEEGNGEWVGHASCTVPLTVEELNQDAERFYRLIHTPTEELLKKEQS